MESRELDQAFRLTGKGSTVLCDPRHGKDTRHTMLPRYDKWSQERWVKEGSLR